MLYWCRSAKSDSHSFVNFHVVRKSSGDDGPGKKGRMDIERARGEALDEIGGEEISE